MEQLLTKLRLFFGMEENTTESEVSSKLTEELKAKMIASTSTTDDVEETDEVNAGDKGGDTVTETVDPVNATSTEEAPQPLTAADLTAVVKAAVDPIATRLAKLEGSDAAPSTGGKTETPPKTEDAPSYMSSAVNQEVAAMLARKQK